MLMSCISISRLYGMNLTSVLLAICRPTDCTVVSSVVVVIGICNCSQMRTSKYTHLVFGISIGLDPARNAQKEFLIGQSSRSHVTYRRPSLDGF